MFLVRIPSTSGCVVAQVRTVTLIPGDGIGPEISAAVQQIFAAANVGSLSFCVDGGGGGGGGGGDDDDDDDDDDDGGGDGDGGLLH